MKIQDVKREYQLQEWSSLLKEQKESGLSVKAWCAERGISEHTYYYRLRKVRQAVCTVLEQTQPACLLESVQNSCLTEVPVHVQEVNSHAKLRLTTKVGTLEITDAEPSVLEQVLRVILHAE